MRFATTLPPEPRHSPVEHRTKKIIGEPIERLQTIVILNQTVGPTTIDLANAFCAADVKVELYAGSVQATTNSLDDRVKLYRCAPYHRGNAISRALSWSLYSFQTLLRLSCSSTHGKALLAVSNPPSNLISGWIMHKLRGVPYHLLVFDVYPDALVQYGYASRSNLLVRILGRLTRASMHSADSVFTISERLRDTLLAYCSLRTEIHVVHNWVDTEQIRPISASENQFRTDRQLVQKRVVLYSGNFGKSHDIATILDAARILQKDGKIHFLLIGGGEQFATIQNKITSENSENVTLLPLQPPEIFPQSIACGDVAVVTLDPAADCLSVPSKIYYLMASGTPVIATVGDSSEVANLIRKHEMGIIVAPGKADELAQAIRELSSDEIIRSKYAVNARAASSNYTPRNASLIRDRILNVERGGAPGKWPPHPQPFSPAKPEEKGAKS